MSKRNIHFHNKTGKGPKISRNICLLELSEEFPRTQKRVRITHCKRVIDVRVIEVLLSQPTFLQLGP